MSLTMSSCSGETFTCNSGACIPLANKCNSKIDCEDESDESQCAYLEVGIGIFCQRPSFVKGGHFLVATFPQNFKTHHRVSVFRLG